MPRAPSFCFFSGKRVGKHKSKFRVNSGTALGCADHVTMGRRALPLVGFVHFAVLRATLPAELCGSLWVRMESTVDAATDCWSGTWTARFRLCLALAIGRWLPFRRHGC